MAMLTAGELEVMQVLWGHGELKPAEIQKSFGRPVKNATLRSALRVLLEKGHVTRRKVGMAYYYRSKTPDRNAFRRMSRRLAQVFCGGSSAALVARLIGRGAKSNRPDDADRDVILNRIEVYERETAPVLDAYPKKLIARVNGDQPPLAVLRDVAECLIGCIPPRI